MSVRTHEEYLARRYFPELDGLRAVSILLVFTTHIDALFWERLHGSTGVTVFFALSGYLITTLALREEAVAGRLDLVSFYLRRVFRIYPLYVAVLLFYVVLVLGLGMAADRRAAFVHSLPYYLAFLPEQSLLGTLHGPDAPFSGAWSLGIEEKFYFVWPLLGFVLLAGRLRGRVVALVVAGVGFASAPLFLGDIAYLLQPYSLLAMGCLAAVLLHDGRGYAVLSRVGRPAILLPLLAVIVVVQFTIPQITLGRPLYVEYGMPVTVLLTGILVTRTAVPGWLSVKPLVFLGRISYAFYLIHNFAINGAQMVLPDTGLGQGILAPIVALPLAVGLAWLLHVSIEKPLLKVGHRLAHRRKELRAVPAA